MSSYASVDHEARMRFLMWGWLALVILMVSGIVPARQLAGDYSGNAVLIRPWMMVYNSIILALHATVLGLILYGGAGSLRRAGNTILFWCRRLGLITLGVACLAAITMLAAPVVTGSGPFPPGSPQLQLYTVLVHLPSFFRSLGWACLVFAMLQGCWEERSRLLPYLLIACVIADLGLVTWHWFSTDTAVVAEFHPFVTEPLFLIPWICGSAIFLFLVRSELIRRQKNPEIGTLSGTSGSTKNAMQQFEEKERLEEDGWL